MRIALVSPLIESVPPRGYGGTERVVAYLIDELAALGHHVTLYASGDSQSPARLVAACPAALRASGITKDSMATTYHLLRNDLVLRDAANYDIIHFHDGYLHFPLVSYCKTPTLTTLHGRLDYPEMVPLTAHFSDVPLISISNSQRKPLPDANWRGTVYNGIPPDVLRFSESGGDYLAFLGRISPEKRPDRAIEIAKRSGRRLVVAAKVDPVNETYFREEIEPLLDHPLVKFIGEVDERGKERVLCGALATLFPIDWPEPFGLVMVESMACGTPVIAFNCGSVPEVMEDGVSGFIVDDVESAVAAVGRVGGLSRQECRRYFEGRFTSRNMTDGYLALYESACRETAAGQRASRVNAA